ncbi:uncharacterized protein EAF01_008089 [Botrytis porri]|uniref:uncharacterized protein n=1 Tax=Botrytis porri TaxID=87229 RepID=UPI0019008C2A|nr:uncharacterized protein EAF01_008089 [Botrytis porri]KAF7898876.1 hypothetical protein EAF01_008089 [Botrytis porri]
MRYNVQKTPPMSPRNSSRYNPIDYILSTDTCRPSTIDLQSPTPLIPTVSQIPAGNAFNEFHGGRRICKSCIPRSQQYRCPRISSRKRPAAPPQTFKFFLDLPIDIRFEICRLICNEARRIIPVVVHWSLLKQFFLALITPRTPNILHVCRKSREHALKYHFSLVSKQLSHELPEPAVLRGYLSYYTHRNPRITSSSPSRRPGLRSSASMTS